MWQSFLVLSEQGNEAGSVPRAVPHLMQCGQSVFIAQVGADVALQQVAHCKEERRGRSERAPLCTTPGSGGSGAALLALSSREQQHTALPPASFQRRLYDSHHFHMAVLEQFMFSSFA